MTGCFLVFMKLHSINKMFTFTLFNVNLRCFHAGNMTNNIREFYNQGLRVKITVCIHMELELAIVCWVFVSDHDILTKSSFTYKEIYRTAFGVLIYIQNNRRVQ